MAREFAITLYLLAFRILFSLFSLLPLQKKAVFVASFGDNCEYLLNEMDKQQLTWKRVILRKSRSSINVKDDGKTIVFHFEGRNLVHQIKSIYHLATAKRIIVDNYFGFLAAVRFRPGVSCTQVWHASGAIKKFGLADPSIAGRSETANKRFLQVYRQFHHIACGSERMAAIFKESFDLPDSYILRTGVPRTDFFFRPDAEAEAKRVLLSRYPEWKGKKTILYAPTFRNDSLHSGKIMLNLDLLYSQLADKGFILLLRLHPAVQADIELDTIYPGFVYNLSDYPDMNELLLGADYLITDYSSIPFEYSFLNRPMLFFAYDLEEYEKERGFWEDYETNMPGPVARTTEELIGHLLNSGFDSQTIQAFNQKWNEYSDGRSSRKLVEFLFQDKD